MYIIYRGTEIIAKVRSKVDAWRKVERLFDEIDYKSDQMTKIFVIDTRRNEVVINLEVIHF